MLRILAATTLFTVLFGAGMADAQNVTAPSVGRMMPGDIASATNSAVETLTSAAKDKVLVKDLLGASVTVPEGDTVGTVENLGVFPGGRVVAAIVKTNISKIGRIAVPFSAVKLSQASGKIGMTLPASLSELTGMKETQKLNDLIPSL